MALTTIKTGGLADNSVTDAKVADAITVTGAQTGITQVGTLTAGTWNGTAIASAYLDADTAHLSGSTFTGSVQVSHGTTPDFTLNDTGGTTNKRVFRISGGGDAVYFEGRNNDNSGDGASGTIQTLSLSDSSVTFAGQLKIDTDQRYFTKWETTYGTDRDYWWRNDGGLLQLGEGAEGDAQVKYTFDTANKRLGIGLTAPTDPLHVKTTAVETRISLESSTGKWAIGAEDNDKFGILNYGTSTPFIIDSSGNVGIGTTSPDQIFHISNTGTHTTMRIENGNADFLIQAGNAGDDGLHFYDLDNSAYRMTIDNAGQVGIGTTSPGDILELDGTNPIFKIGNRIRIKADESNADAWFGAGSDLNTFKFGDADFGTSAMTIKLATGRVGIGTTSPEGLLHIDGANAVSSSLVVGDQSGTEDAAIFMLAGTGVRGCKLATRHALNGFEISMSDGDGNTSNFTPVLVVTDDTRCVGIGTTSPSQVLHVETAGNTYVTKIDNSHGSTPYGLVINYSSADPNTSNYPFIAGAATGTDRFKIFSDGSYSDISDERQKENIKDTESQLANINKLEIKDYNRIGDESKGDHIGVIAQQIEPIYPHLVRTSDDEQKTKMVYKIGLISPLIKAVQELSAEVEALKNG